MGDCSSDPLSFFLKVRGYPEPQVTWHRNGQPIPSAGRFLLDCGIRGNFSLIIHAVQEEDQGKYTCEAKNGRGARQVTVELTVEGKSQGLEPSLGLSCWCLPQTPPLQGLELCLSLS